MAERAVFLDRDGVINVERAYVHRVADFEFIAGAAAAMARLHRAGWKLVVVTNQSGIARGYYTEAQYDALTAHMRQQLAQAGAPLDAVLYCPHLPDAEVMAYRQACDCRKPAPGLLLQAARALALDLSRSVLVGDKVSDIQAGRAAGVGHCVLVRSGHALTTADESAADAVHADLAACVDALLRRAG